MLKFSRLRRIKEYYRDKQLAEKCGLEVKDICTHETDNNVYFKYTLQYKCSKCGEFYE